MATQRDERHQFALTRFSKKPLTVYGVEVDRENDTPALLMQHVDALDRLVEGEISITGMSRDEINYLSEQIDQRHVDDIHWRFRNNLSKISKYNKLRLSERFYSVQQELFGFVSETWEWYRTKSGIPRNIFWEVQAPPTLDAKVRKREQERMRAFARYWLKRTGRETSKPLTDEEAQLLAERQQAYREGGEREYRRVYQRQRRDRIKEAQGAVSAPQPRTFLHDEGTRARYREYHRQQRVRLYEQAASGDREAIAKLERLRQRDRERKRAKRPALQA